MVLFGPFAHNKKAGLHVAVPLTEALVLPYHPNKQQESTPMYIPLRVDARKLLYIQTNGHLCYNVLDDYEFTRFL